MQIHIETLTSTGIHTYGTYSREEFSVEMTILGKRRLVPTCTKWGEGDNAQLNILGLAVRFSQGAKVWPGTACYWFARGSLGNLRPNIDKRGHFSCVGLIEDFDTSSKRSNHNAVA